MRGISKSLHPLRFMTPKSSLRTLAIVIAMAASLPQFTSALEVATTGAEPGKWTMDFDAATKLAGEKKMPILLNFTGSDWCGWCKLMDEAVYSKKEWQDYAAKNLLLVTIDFPQDEKIVPEKYKARNGRMQEEFKVEGYPTYVILDSDGKTVIGRLGAGQDKTPETFIGEVEEALRLSPANIEKKVAELGPDKGAAFKAALDGMKSAEADFKAWLATRPQRSPENDAKFEAFQKRMAEANKAVTAF